LVNKLNPDAEIIPSHHGLVPMTKIINTKKFDFEKAQTSAGWMKELLKPLHTPETEEYGIKSWIYRRNRLASISSLSFFLVPKGWHSHGVLATGPLVCRDSLREVGKQ